MTISRRALGLTVSFALGFLTACATTTMQSVQPAPGFDSGKIHKVLVIGVMRTPALRKLFEEEFVRQWKEHGIEADASSAVLPSDITLDKAGIAPLAKARGYDTVLVTRLLSREEAEAQFPTNGEKKNSGSSPDDALLSQHLQIVIASPEYGADYQVTVVRTNLYDANTEQRIWSGVSQTLVTEDAAKLIHPFIKTILKNIYK